MEQAQVYLIAEIQLSSSLWSYQIILTHVKAAEIFPFLTHLCISSPRFALFTVLYNKPQKRRDCSPEMNPCAYSLEMKWRKDESIRGRQKE